MRLFFNIYKKQIISILLVFTIIGLISILNITEVRLIASIALGVVCLIPAFINISKHLTTPVAFRKCDFKYIIGLSSLTISIICTINIIQIINN